MDIAQLIDGTVMEHLSLYGCIRNLDPYATHLLKTSQHPVLRFRRNWMRQMALKQVLDAEKRQQKRNSALAKTPVNRKSSLRQEAVIDPYYAEDMRRKHNVELNDKDFIGFVKRNEPSFFPQRETA